MKQVLKRILIAEDEMPMANALKIKLSKSDFDVEVVHDGQAVLDTLSKEKFDLLLLDLIMPKLNGFDVIKSLKEMKDKTPILILSNLSQEEDRKKAMALGADNYFIKSDTSITDIVNKVSEFFK